MKPEDVETVTLTLPLSVVERMRALVLSGEFLSIDEVFLDAWERRKAPELYEEADEQDYEQEQQELQQSVREFEASNEPFEEMLTIEEMRALLDADRRRLGQAA